MHEPLSSRRITNSNGHNKVFGIIALFSLYPQGVRVFPFRALLNMITLSEADPRRQSSGIHKYQYKWWTALRGYSGMA